MQNIQLMTNELVNKMMKDRLVRTSITKDSFLYFFHFYYAHYVKYKTADFQKEMIFNLESNALESLYIVAFRGSGKSTLVTTAYPIWAILGKQQKKFCVIFCQTRMQAKQHMSNIKTELEVNDLLKKDLGPFREESDEWGSYSLVFNKSGARITVASTEQSIRGLRHGQHRPDLIICDDVEDVQSTKTREGREKTYNWLRGEIIPLGDKNTRLIIVGNLLHEDSLLMRIKNEVEEEKAVGIFRAYPLIDDTGYCLWEGKYENEEDLENEKKKVSNEVSWQREYLLNIVPDDGQVIYPEWIQYYDVLPQMSSNTLVFCYIGVDLAISQKDTADYTAMVTGYQVIGKNDSQILYILPNPVNKRLTFPETTTLCKALHRSNQDSCHSVKLLIESVAYQASMVQQLQNDGIHEVLGVNPGGSDKRTRLALVSSLIQSGNILFPKTGCEELLQQMIHFGVEKHDDLVDAFTMVANHVVTKPYVEPRITVLKTYRRNSYRYQEDDGDF